MGIFGDAGVDADMRASIHRRRMLTPNSAIVALVLLVSGCGAVPPVEETSTTRETRVPAVDADAEEDALRRAGSEAGHSRASRSKAAAATGVAVGAATSADASRMSLAASAHAAVREAASGPPRPA
jgi:hypothetical protein